MNTDHIRQHALSIRDAIEGTVKQMNTIHSELERHRLLADHLKELLDIERHFLKVAGIHEVKIEAGKDFFEKRVGGFAAMSAADKPYDPKAPMELKNEEAVMPNAEYTPSWKTLVAMNGSISKARELLNMKVGDDFFVQLVPAIERMKQLVTSQESSMIELEDRINSDTKQIQALTDRNTAAGNNYTELIRRFAVKMGFVNISAMQLETEIEKMYEEVKTLRTTGLRMLNAEELAKKLAAGFEIKEEEYGNMDELGPNHNKLIELVLSKRANYINQINSRDNVLENIKNHLGFTEHHKIQAVLSHIRDLKELEKNLVQFGVISSAAGIQNSDTFQYGVHQVVELKDLATQPPAIGASVYYVQKG